MLYLKRNLPAGERAIRVVVALATAAAAVLLLPAGPACWLGLASAVGIALTALVGFCPACALVGRRPLDR
jgi:hypothetical protein